MPVLGPRAAVVLVLTLSAVSAAADPCGPLLHWWASFGALKPNRPLDLPQISKGAISAAERAAAARLAPDTDVTACTKQLCTQQHTGVRLSNPHCMVVLAYAFSRLPLAGHKPRLRWPNGDSSYLSSTVPHALPHEPVSSLALAMVDERPTRFDPHCKQIKGLLSKPMHQREMTPSRPNQAACVPLVRPGNYRWRDETCLLKNSGSFALLLNELGLLGVGVEVGVWAAEHATIFRSKWGGRKLYLVDPYTSPTNAADAQFQIHAQYRNQSVPRTKLVAAQTRAKERMQLTATPGSYKFVQLSSVAAAQRFSDESLDFVYLDGAHEYAAIKEDLKAWFPKVKVGGILAGHDYSSVFGVPLAVHEVLARGHQFCIADQGTPRTTSFYTRKCRSVCTSEGDKSHCAQPNEYHG